MLQVAERNGNEMDNTTSTRSIISLCMKEESILCLLLLFTISLLCFYLIFSNAYKCDVALLKNQDECSIDSDKDGTPDCADYCPFEPSKKFPDGCGCEKKKCDWQQGIDEEDVRNWNNTEIDMWISSISIYNNNNNNNNNKQQFDYFLSSKVPDSVLNAYWNSCWNDTDFFRMNADALCTQLWLRKMKEGKVKRVSKVLSVITREEEATFGKGEKTQQNGGIHCHLSTNIDSYFKPCYGNTGSEESYLHEIMSFHIDKFLGFFRTPAVMPYTFASSELLELAANLEKTSGTKGAVDAMHSIINKCGTADKQHVEGAMIAWSNFPVKQLHGGTEAMRYGELPKSHISSIVAKSLSVSNRSSFKDVYWAISNSVYNIFGIITCDLGRSRHNIFKLTNAEQTVKGPFVFIDNDRAHWTETAEEHYKELTRNNPIFKLCRFPTRLANKILFLASPNNNRTLGKIMLHSSKIYGSAVQMGELFDESQVANVDANVKYVANAIQSCISKYGKDSVLLDEPWHKKYDPFQQLLSVLN